MAQSQSHPTSSQFDRDTPVGFDGDDPTWAIAATEPRPPRATKTPPPTPTKFRHEYVSDEFVPESPSTFRESGLSESQVEALVAKFLLSSGASTGRNIAQQMCLPFGMIERLLHSMKLDQLVVIKSEGPIGDYVYELTSPGLERARRYSQQTTYFGSAPVPLQEYVKSVKAQSIRHQPINMERVREAFNPLVLGHKMLAQLGEAMNMGCSMFIHGQPGNGKTSIAQSIIKAYGKTVWIPRAIYVGGEIVRLFDPIHHKERPLPESHPDNERVDNRWVRIQRPTIVVGGELELNDLDVATNPVTGINEASLQMKANCGTLVIDDFGRNRFRPAELLNRLIYPLENRVDALHVSSGRTFQVPFDCLVVFSTNLDPMDLIDEAFLRRVPFSIHIPDPSCDEFRQVFHAEARRCKVQFESEHLDYLVEHHYKQSNREMRFCHPRDLISHIRNACDFRGQEAKISQESIDFAVTNMLSLRQSHQADS
jgi:predicted ATPase with chaperone activity